MSRLTSARAGVPNAKQPGAKPGSKRGFKGFRKVRGGHYFRRSDHDARSVLRRAPDDYDDWQFMSYWVRP